MDYRRERVSSLQPRADETNSGGAGWSSGEGADRRTESREQRPDRGWRSKSRLRRQERSSEQLIPENRGGQGGGVGGGGGEGGAEAAGSRLFY